MLRLLDLPRENSASARAIVPEQDRPLQPPAGSFRWIDASAPTPQELDELKRAFDLHPIAIEDATRFDQRPKLVEYRDHIFTVTHRLRMDGAERPEIVGTELHVFIGEEFLVTVHDASCGLELDRIRERLLGKNVLDGRGPAFIYYLAAEQICANNQAVLEKLFDVIDDIEDEVLQQKDADALPELFHAKRNLATARRMLAPQREVLLELVEMPEVLVSERTRPYFRRIQDLLARQVESLDGERDILTNVLDAHLSIVSNRTNQIMKALTLLSAIFLPLGFVTGFFGQNFSHLPFDSRLVMWVSLGACLLIPAGMLFWYWKRNWL